MTSSTTGNEEPEAQYGDCYDFPTSQIGGGTPCTLRKRRLSTLSYETPTRLRTVVHASSRDVGLVSRASDRRAQLVPGGPSPTVPSAPPVMRIIPFTPVSTGLVGPSHPKRVPRGASPATLPSSPQPLVHGTSAEPLSAPTSPHEAGKAPPATPPSNQSLLMHTTSQEPPSAPTSPHGTATGRMSEQNRRTLLAGFKEVLEYFRNLAERTELSMDQVLSVWEKQNGQKHKGPGNPWNAYESYIKHPQNRDEELCRCGFEPGLFIIHSLVVELLMTIPDSQLTVEVRTTCFKGFKRAFPDSWSDILETWDDIRMNEPPRAQTLAQRARTFQKYTSEVIQRVRRYAWMMILYTHSSLGQFLQCPIWV